jgi:molecular chaperone HscA
VPWWIGIRGFPAALTRSANQVAVTGMRAPACPASLLNIGSGGLGGHVGRDVVLAVDLGTSNTVAVVRRGNEPPRALLFDGSPLLPSGVYAAPDGGLLAGRDAERMLIVDPGGFEPHPKRRIDERVVLLGGREVAVVELLAATLFRVAAEAVEAGVDPVGHAVLAHPAGWGPVRRDVLRAAAAYAGLGEVELIAEPVAAATYCAEVLGQRLGVGECILVFDFGGGTVDVAVVRRDVDGLAVLASGGLDDLGGVDIDSALVGHLQHVMRAAVPRNPQEWLRLYAEARGAKEMLSRTAVAPVSLQGGAVHVTRDELDRLALPLVDRAVERAHAVLDEAGVRRATVLLVGGSSRIPLVARQLHVRLGVAPTVPEQRELPVAHGALVATTPRATPDLTPPERPAAAEVWPELAPQPVTTRPRARRWPTFLAAFLAMALLFPGSTLAYAWWSDWKARNAPQIGYENVLNNQKELSGTESVTLPAGERDGTAATADGPSAFYVSTGTTGTAVGAVDVQTGRAIWQKQAPITGTFARITVIDTLVLVETSGRSGGLAVFTVGTGALLWQTPWSGSGLTSGLLVGADLVAVDHRAGGTSQAARIDLRTGTPRWTRPVAGDARTAPVLPITTWAPREQAGTVVAPREQGPFRTSLRAVTDRVVVLAPNDTVEVLDVATGQPVASGKVPGGSVAATAFDDALYLSTETGTTRRTTAFGLGDLKQRWQREYPKADLAVPLTPCGEKRLCDWSGGDATEIQPLDTVTGELLDRSGAVGNLRGTGHLAVLDGFLILSRPDQTVIVRNVAPWLWQTIITAETRGDVRALAAAGNLVVLEKKESRRSQVVALTLDPSQTWASEPMRVGDVPPLSVAIADGMILMVNGDRKLVLIRT